MKNNALLRNVLIVLLSLIVLSFILSKTGFAIYQASAISEEYLETLRLKANVECLQNSQCLEGYECMNTKCVNIDSVNLCPDTSLSTSATPLKVGDSINSGKRVLSYSDLPYLLADGRIVEIVNNETIEYLYSPAILIKDSKIEKENGNYVIKQKSNSEVLVYRFSFSKNVDFSSKSMKGQALRILGKEYVIGDDSTNSAIYLIADKEKIELESGGNVRIGTFSKAVEGTSVNMLKDERGIAMFEIIFKMQGNINNNKYSIGTGEKYIDPVFNTVKLSFNNVNNEFADIRIGGNCA